MGWKLERCDVCLGPNEEQDLTIKLRKEKRAAIHGVVKLNDGIPAKNAVVKLFKKVDHCKLIPITFAFTDECGQFLFGVKSGINYVVKVFFYTPEKITPTPCDHDVCDKDDFDLDC